MLCLLRHRHGPTRCWSACREPTFSTSDGIVKSVSRYGRTRVQRYGDVRRPRAARRPVPGVPAKGRSSRRRTPRRGLWVLLALVLLACLVVAAIFVWYSERPPETMALTAVDRPASAEPPEPPVPPARVRAVEELDELLRGIPRAHAGTHGAVL